MKKNYLFIPQAKQWNSLIRKFVNLHKRIKKGKASERQTVQMTSKLKSIYKRLEKMQYKVGIKLAGSALALMLISATSFSQEFTSIGNLTFSEDMFVISYSVPEFVDIDGDDDLDLFIGHPDGFVKVFTNDGTGTFISAGNMQADGADIDAGYNPTPVFEDIDGDGDPDLYVGERYGTVKVYTNDGTGIFSATGNLQADGIDINIGQFPNPVFADIDEDNDLDLYIGESEGYIKVFTNDGTGTFSSAPDLQADGADIDIGWHSAPEFADIDGDDDLDLYIGENYGYIKVFTNDGNGNFFAADDFQADGADLDISFLSTPEFADIDNDGDLDLYVGELYGLVNIFINDGTGIFSAAGNMQAVAGDVDVGFYATPVFADIDEDNDLDLFIGESGGHIKVFINDGTGIFSPATDLQADGSNIDEGNFSTPVFADVDSDNDLDLYLGIDPGTIMVFVNDGTGTFSSIGNLQADGIDIDVGWSSKPAFADIDDDSDLDLYVGEFYGAVKVFINDGTGTFSASADLQANGTDIDAGNSSAPVFADIDDDSDLDLYIGNSGGIIQVFTNDGTGTFSSSGNLQADGTDINVGNYSDPAFGNFVPCSFNFFIGNQAGIISVYQMSTDIINPTINSTHNDQTVDADSNCESVLLDYTGDVTATDNCDTNLEITQLPIPGTAISGTTNNITLIATDDGGNTDEVSFNVEVADITNPTITSTHNDQTADADANCESILADYTGDVTAIDNCDTDLDIAQSPIAGTVISGAINTITLTATDDAGNGTDIMFNVEVIDNIDPTITCVDNQVVDADDTNTYTVVGTEFDPTEVDDNCGVAGVLNDYNSLATLDGAVLPVGTTTVIWTVTDDAGNEGTCSFDVLVNEYVSINDLFESGVVVSPNPTDGILTVETDDSYNVSVSDISGKIVNEFVTNNNKQTIDLSNHPAGIYFLKFQNNKRVKIIKIIVK